MKKKNEVKQWGLWNYGVLFFVDRTKRDCRNHLTTLMCGGEDEADRALRDGSFHISKVIVREI